ncbi:hypothetical protein, conserved [Eimeria maxima]|uniref:Protein kinase domain-containing protein n=1 Tax=Eimeria maxima TaxID=5804 RepID=U6M2T8_EIMMA|nr:hypothetical protein, conserved [Eimeria maxima]CDJ56749.1 hypothetical protein, conserved [Eimeria maxima]
MHETQGEAMWGQLGGVPPHPDRGLELHGTGKQQGSVELPVGGESNSSLSSLVIPSRHRWSGKWTAILTLLLTLTAVGVAHRRANDVLKVSTKTPGEAMPTGGKTKRRNEKQPAPLRSRDSVTGAAYGAGQESVGALNGAESILGFDESPVGFGDRETSGYREFPHANWMAPAAEWHLPRTEEADTSPEGVAARRFLVELATKVCSGVGFENVDSLPTPQERDLAAAVAETLTMGRSSELVGLEVQLGNMMPLGRAVNPVSFIDPVRINRIVGSGVSSLYVEAYDEASGRFVTLRLHLAVADDDRQLSIEVTNRWVEIAMETRALVLACGDDSVSCGTTTRGLLIADHVGALVTADPNHRDGRMTIFQRVEVYERLVSHLLPLAFSLQYQRSPQALQAKAYIATRLVLQALHLHQAGVCHNGLSWRNLFINQQGTVLLGGLETLKQIGEALTRRDSLDPHYADPKLVADFFASFRQDMPAFTHEKNDMWSLGVLLFELFTGEELDSEFREGITTGAITQDELAERLQATGISSEWRTLVQGLLEPDREQRLSAEGAARIFRKIWERRKKHDKTELQLSPPEFLVLCLLRPVASSQAPRQFNNCCYPECLLYTAQDGVKFCGTEETGVPRAEEERGPSYIDSVKTLASLTVLSFTVSFFLAIASVLAVFFSFFSIYWIVFTGIHIFCSMVAVGAAYAQFRGIATQEHLEETVPIAASLPKVTEAV